jgi:hypothetical protein
MHNLSGLPYVSADMCEVRVSQSTYVQSEGSGGQSDAVTGVAYPFNYTFH